MGGGKIKLLLGFGGREVQTTGKKKGDPGAPQVIINQPGNPGGNPHLTGIVICWWEKKGKGQRAGIYPSS